MKRYATVAEKVAARTLQADGCWIWTGNVNPATGYGRLGHNYRNHAAHRLSYELAKGPIPEGLVIDHLCHNADTSCRGGGSCQHRRCVNPDHLEAVLHRVNTLRGFGIPAQSARATACKHGHEWTPENTLIQRGKRLCVTCKKRRDDHWNGQRRSKTPKDPTRCGNGHEWTERSTYVKPSNGARECRTCHRDRERAYRAARKENAA